MSYVPPHKRQEGVAVKASSVPPSLRTKLNNTKKIYADDCIRKWFLASSQEDNKFQLVPVSPDAEWKRGGAEEKPLFLLIKNVDLRKLETPPWLWVAEKVEDDLILGFDRAKKTHGTEDANLRLIARFGKVLFHSDNSSKTLRDGQLSKSMLGKMKKSFNTNVTKSYLENIEYGVVHKIGFRVEDTKELYHVKVSDNTRLDVTISCKCKVDQQHKQLNFYKAELNAMKHLVLDVSCFDQDLDMRLSVDSKRTLTNLSENEIKSLKELTDSAVIDLNVKGGLKWPLGKSSCANRYRVCGVWHTVATTYRNPSLSLQVREADRYDFRTGIGGTSKEVFLKLKALSKKLLKEEEEMERKCVSDMLKDGLKAAWDYFLKAV